MKIKTQALLAQQTGLRYRSRITDWLKGRTNVRNKGTAIKLGELTGSKWEIWMAGANSRETQQNIQARREAVARWSQGRTPKK